ncbi:hypothetical protein BC332_33931 [Capsicum chinense]|nr:hypothetical protein BC332_33931 [Capsicum chinense]
MLPNSSSHNSTDSSSPPSATPPKHNDSTSIPSHRSWVKLLYSQVCKHRKMNFVLTNGPWFVYGHYLSIQKWVSNFTPKKATLISSAVWTRLPHLPTEYYDHILLQKVGNSIGRLLKLRCTSATLIGRYAWLCIQMCFNTPFPTWIRIGHHMQNTELDFYPKNVAVLATATKIAFSLIPTQKKSNQNILQHKLPRCMTPSDRLANHSVSKEKKASQPR